MVQDEWCKVLKSFSVLKLVVVDECNRLSFRRYIYECTHFELFSFDRRSFTLGVTTFRCAPVSFGLHLTVFESVYFYCGACSVVCLKNFFRT